jgi:hypothetical protein
MQDEQPPPETTGTNGSSAVPPSDRTDPFKLPEYEWAFFRFVQNAVDRLIRAKNPVLSKMDTEPSSELYTSRNTTDSGEVLENKPILTSLEIAINFKDVVTGKLEAVAETIDQAAEEGVGTIVPQIAVYMGRVIDAFGKEVRLNGAPFDHAAVRKLVEANEIEFDANGNPDLEPWIFTDSGLQRVTTFDELVRRFPPRTTEEVQAWDDVIDRKRREFNAKRRRRALS